ncbi:unnamed protein product [Linum trigynum]|uniref:Uncharacterized protein n=1 Tax=Linum trigynum TaxID=586398 RepID=A0AAV2GLK6_9ROSI
MGRSPIALDLTMALAAEPRNLKTHSSHPSSNESGQRIGVVLPLVEIRRGWWRQSLRTQQIGIWKRNRQIEREGILGRGIDKYVFLFFKRLIKGEA